MRGLPDYFTEDVPAKLDADLGAHLGWVVTEADDLVGFAVVERRAQGAAEFLWMAVRASRRGGGIGTTLLDQVLDELAGDGVHVVEAKTLDRGAAYTPYVATRAFWEGRGFVQIDTIDPLPGWQPGNPSAIYVAALSATR